MTGRNSIKELRTALDVAEDVETLLSSISADVSVVAVEIDTEKEGCYYIALRICNG